MATVFLTGAGGGFGKLIATDLVAAGHKVVGTLREVSSRNQSVAGELERLGITVLEMDVTNDASVASAVHEAERRFGGLDVVVNNAGVGVLGVQETFTPADLQRIFDVNVFGVHRVNRAALRGMRARRSGLLVHVSSLLGRLAVPYYGPYNASKWALEALADNYRVEVSGFGVDSVIIEPGGFPTTFIDNLVRPGDAERVEELREFARRAEMFLETFEGALASNEAQNPKLVAEAIVRVIAMPAGQRPARTIVDHMGMGAAVAPYNEMFAAVTSGLYKAFHIEDMLTLKP
jgi:NAD(P)-dependent dehydrogenase (short-subunit alcohol dehydrogenase family)